jgi:uncharacterized protein (DUF697 family)
LRRVAVGRTEVSVFVRVLRFVEIVVGSPVAIEAFRAAVWSFTEARRVLC